MLGPAGRQSVGAAGARQRLRHHATVASSDANVVWRLCTSQSGRCASRRTTVRLGVGVLVLLYCCSRPHPRRRSRKPAMNAMMAKMELPLAALGCARRLPIVVVALPCRKCLTYTRVVSSQQQRRLEHTREPRLPPYAQPPRDRECEPPVEPPASVATPPLPQRRHLGHGAPGRDLCIHDVRARGRQRPDRRSVSIVVATAVLTSRWSSFSLYKNLQTLARKATSQYTVS